MNLARNLLTPRERLVFLRKPVFSERMWWVSGVCLAALIGTVGGMILQREFTAVPAKCSATTQDGRRLTAYHIVANQITKCTYEASRPFRKG